MYGIKNSEFVSSSSVSFKWILLCDEQDCISRIRCSRFSPASSPTLPFRFSDGSMEMDRNARCKNGVNATSVAHVWRQLFFLTKSIDGAAVMHCRLLWKIYFKFRSLYELFLSTFHGTLRHSRARALVPSRITSSGIQPSYTAISQIRSSSVCETRRDPFAFRAARQREGETDERVSQSPVA